MESWHAGRGDAISKCPRRVGKQHSAQRELVHCQYAKQEATRNHNFQRQNITDGIGNRVNETVDFILYLRDVKKNVER